MNLQPTCTKKLFAFAIAYLQSGLSIIEQINKPEYIDLKSKIDFIG